MSAILRRKRLQDGTLGELEKVFEGETDQEKLERLEIENKDLKDQMLDFREYVLQLELGKLMNEGGM